MFGRRFESAHLHHLTVAIMKQLKFLSVVLAAGALVSCGNNGGSGLKMGDVIGMQQTWTGTREYSSSSSSSESGDLSAYDDWTEESLKKENQQIIKDFLNDLDEGKEKEEPALQRDEPARQEVRRADPEPEISVAPEASETLVNGMPSWLLGKWVCKTAYGTETMWIESDIVRSDSDSGTYTYSNGELRIKFSRERGVVTSIPVDVANQRLEYGGGYYWVKSY